MERKQDDFLVPEKCSTSPDKNSPCKKSCNSSCVPNSRCCHAGGPHRPKSCSASCRHSQRCPREQCKIEYNTDTWRDNWREEFSRLRKMWSNHSKLPDYSIENPDPSDEDISACCKKPFCWHDQSQRKPSNARCCCAGGNSQDNLNQRELSSKQHTHYTPQSSTVRSPPKNHYYNEDNKQSHPTINQDAQDLSISNNRTRKILIDNTPTYYDETSIKNLDAKSHTAKNINKMTPQNSSRASPKVFSGEKSGTDHTNEHGNTYKGAGPSPKHERTRQKVQEPPEEDAIQTIYNERDQMIGRGSDMNNSFIKYFPKNQSPKQQRNKAVKQNLKRDFDANEQENKSRKSDRRYSDPTISSTIKRTQKPTKCINLNLQFNSIKKQCEKHNFGENNVNPISLQKIAYETIARKILETYPEYFVIGNFGLNSK